jgi:cytochrome c-type biogenesis protein CcsB
MMIWVLMLAASQASAEMGRLASDPADRLSTIPHSPAMQDAIRRSDLRMVAVNHEGWRETLLTFARLKIHQITGRTTIKGQDPVYTVLSMMFQPEQWQNARILPVEHPDILEKLKLDHKWVTPDQILRNPLLPSFIDEVRAGRELKAKLDSTVNLLNAVEQTRRLGREMRVLDAFSEQGIAPADIISLLEDREQHRIVMQRRVQELKAWNAARPLVEAGERLIMRARTFTQLANELLIVPDTEAVDEGWIRPALHQRAGMRTLAAGRQFELDLAMALALDQPEKIEPAAKAFLGVIEESRLYPGRTWREWYNWYVTYNPWRLSAVIYLLGVVTLGVYFFFMNAWLYRLGMLMLGAGFVFHTAAVGVRLYLTGHAPVSNMFESITFCSWAVILIAIVFEAVMRRGLVALGAMTMGFLLLTGAGLMPLHETRLHPLRAVLNSYWLNIHVTLMLLSYAAFAIAAFFSMLYLVRSLEGSLRTRVALIGLGGGFLLLGGWKLMGMLFPGVPLDSLPSLLAVLMLTGGVIGVLTASLVGGAMAWDWLQGRAGFTYEVPIPLPQMEEFAYRLVQVGWPILTFGITLGAVWADTAWGRYWGWDPKETWAFITWVAYTVYLHSRMVMGWRGRWSAAACLAGFVMVMITWWGVSYLPWFSGGLHSYASPR